MIIARRKIIYQSENIRELQAKLENIAFDYVCNIEVVPERYYEPSRSRRFGNHPMGHFMVKKPDKITIYNKFKRVGYLYSSIEIQKIITFFLIRPVRLPFHNHETSLRIDDVLIHTSRFSEIHSELLKHPKIEEILISLGDLIKDQLSDSIQDQE